MAIREVRAYLNLADKVADRALSREIGIPFFYYMEAVMRGRLKEYSGPEVKGVNIVNLHLFEPSCSQRINPTCATWYSMMNFYGREAEFDFNELVGAREERLDKLVAVFVRFAEESPLPQMQTLARHTRESRDKTPLGAAIKTGDAHWKWLMGRDD